MTRHKTYTPLTSLVTHEIGEILMNNGLTIKQFHMVKPIHMVAGEIRCLSKRHFATVMQERCSVYPPVPFDVVLSNTHSREYYQDGTHDITGELLLTK